MSCPALQFSESYWHGRGRETVVSQTIGISSPIPILTYLKSYLLCARGVNPLLLVEFAPGELFLC
jgi:hypothetical protein